MRTPTANARAVAARDPRRPGAGGPVHRALGARQRPQRLLRARGHRVLRGRARWQPACTTVTDEFAPTPVTPTKLANVHPPHGSRRTARTDARGGARHARRPQPPGDRGDAAGRPGTAERLELRRPARRLRQAHPRARDPQGLLVRPRRRSSPPRSPIRDHRLQPGDGPRLRRARPRRAPSASAALHPGHRHARRQALRPRASPRSGCRASARANGRRSATVLATLARAPRVRRRARALSASRLP